MLHTHDFLDQLYGEKPPEAWFLLWANPPKASHWFQHTHEAADIIASLNGVNVYCSIALGSENLGPKHRTKAKQATGIVGFIADVDLMAPDKKKQYPPTETEANAIIEATELEPSILVHSGHGLQPWWLFREPWIFDDDEERAVAIALAKDWGNTVQEHATRQGYYVDSVHDLARIMRVPGTTNWKQEDKPVPVTVIEDSGRRYNPDDFSDLLLSVSAVEVPGSAPKDVALSSDPAKLPFPFNKHEALLSNSEEYANSWNRIRKGGKDNSPSAWDQSLANYAAQAGLSDDEIAALLVGARRKHGDDLSHKGYYKLTIGKARKGEADIDIKDEEAPRDERIAKLATALNLPIVNVTRFSGEPPVYRFTLDGNGKSRAVEIEAGRLLTQSQFRATLFGLVHKPPRKIGSKEHVSWDDYVQVIADVAIEVESGEDGTVTGEIRALLDEYFSMNPPQTYGERELVEDANRPFVKDGCVWFKLSLLLRFATAQMNLKLQRKTLTHRLLALGAEQKVIAVKTGKRGETTGQTTARFYGTAWDAGRGTIR